MGTPTRSRSEKEEEVREEYLETLRDLTFNSKPLIDVLTNIAEEAKAYASTIVDCIVEQLEKVNYFTYDTFLCKHLSLRFNTL